MQVTELLKLGTKPAFSLEILPKPGLTAEENLQLYREIFLRKPLFVDIPYHAGRSQSGFPAKTDSVLKLLPKTELLAGELLNTYRLWPQPHILCRNFTPEVTEIFLMKLHRLGVLNILLLRGDSQLISLKNDLQHEFAFQLVKQVKNLNAGINWRNEISETSTAFSIGVAGYPEPSEADSELSIKYLKHKVEAGADYIITQLFYDNDKFFAFENDCRQAGISVPIIPGICPVTSLKLLEKLPRFFQVSLPEALQQKIKNCVSQEALTETGIAWTISQAKELYKFGIPCVHFFALTKPENIAKVLTGISDCR